MLIFGCFRFPGAEFSSSKDVREYLSKGGDPNKKFRYRGNPKAKISLLHFAALENDLPLVEFILKAGASPNSIDSTHLTPVMLIFSWFDNLEELKPIIEILHPITDKEIVDDEGRDIYKLVKDYWGEDWVNYLRSIE